MKQNQSPQPEKWETAQDAVGDLRQLEGLSESKPLWKQMMKLILEKTPGKVGSEIQQATEQIMNDQPSMNPQDFSDEIQMISDYLNPHLERIRDHDKILPQQISLKIANGEALTEGEKIALSISKNIDLEFSNLTDQAAKNIAENEEMGAITHLYLDGNPITLEGAMAIANSPNFSSLRYVNLAHTNITPEQKEELQNSFQSKNIQISLY